METALSEWTKSTSEEGHTCTPHPRHILFLFPSHLSLLGHPGGGRGHQALCGIRHRPDKQRPSSTQRKILTYPDGAESPWLWSSLGKLFSQ